MINSTVARELAQKWLETMWKSQNWQSDDSPVIRSDKVIEKNYGWIFFWQSRKYLETDNVLYELLDISPLLVEKADGRVTYLGEYSSAKEHLQMIERERGYRPA